MYAIYRKSWVNSISRYQFVDEVSLFGCKHGYIPTLLRASLPASQNEPYEWHLDIASALADAGKKEHTLIINLKPKTVTPNLSLYEIADVWGRSASGWTPIMMRLRGLFVDEDPKTHDANNFERKPDEIDDPIFSMLYLSGSVENGKIVGRWTAPAASPTNSVLLWPDTFNYFAKEARKLMECLGLTVF